MSIKLLIKYSDHLKLYENNDKIKSTTWKIIKYIIILKIHIRAHLDHLQRSQKRTKSLQFDSILISRSKYVLSKRENCRILAYLDTS